MNVNVLEVTRLCIEGILIHECHHGLLGRHGGTPHLSVPKYYYYLLECVTYAAVTSQCVTYEAVTSQCVTYAAVTSQCVTYAAVTC